MNAFSITPVPKKYFIFVQEQSPDGHLELVFKLKSDGTIEYGHAYTAEKAERAFKEIMPDKDMPKGLTRACASVITLQAEGAEIKPLQ